MAKQLDMILAKLTSSNVRRWVEVVHYGGELRSSTIGLRVASQDLTPPQRWEVVTSPAKATGRWGCLQQATGDRQGPNWNIQDPQGVRSLARKKERSLSWMVLLMLMLMALTCDYHFAEGRTLSKKADMKEIDTMLKVLNKPAIKTIKSVDGDIIDCVDIYKQPAFDHPLLYNHTIQMRPSVYPKGVEAETTLKKIHQPWHLNGRCPKGTVPIRRTRKSDLMSATSLKNFGKKYPEGIRHPQNADDGRMGHVVIIDFVANFPSVTMKKERSLSWMVLLMLMALTSDYHFAEGRILSKKANMKEIDRMLKVLNKPAIKTIKSVDGDIIDCVDIYKQPAFDHPLLYNHTIQMRPSVYPKGVEAETTLKKIHQPWHFNGRCPKGTVPIRRTRKSDLMRATSLKNFGKKYPEGIRHPQNADDARTGHVHAIVSTKKDKYFGGKADLHLWNPRVYGDEFSLAQIWIITKDNENTLEAGWMGDAYRTTGCYNLKCSGFVQVGSEYVLGGVISPVSVYDGHMFYLAVNIFQDVENGNWWLQMENDLVGYWPGSVVPRFADGAEVVQYGGEIVDSGVAHGTGGPHTSTEMGSGHFSGEGEWKAAAFTRLQVMERIYLDTRAPKFSNPLLGSQIVMISQ
ncbi:hypothetical protein QJS10_CPA07g00934 [Acorus calamus]|uniref:Neprosin PEP catalytic domain-containing protein n=1 Tax=Acorus calamus TaxID=4465 RepID=A0AAV9EFW4_ACOCL|nr:hypothetical protein QJS10_CPA07g00934 [Acorus calamus]